MKPNWFRYMLIEFAMHTHVVKCPVQRVLFLKHLNKCKGFFFSLRQNHKTIWKIHQFEMPHVKMPWSGDGMGTGRGEEPTLEWKTRLEWITKQCKKRERLWQWRANKRRVLASSEWGRWNNWSQVPLCSRDLLDPIRCDLINRYDAFFLFL